MNKCVSKEIVFDAETTGTERRNDQIIELCVQFGLADDAPSKVWRIRPDIPISPGAQAVHGISMEDLRDCPPFAAIADEFRQIIADADTLIGYNLNFDIEMVQAEYHRLGQPPLDVAKKSIVDPFRLWQIFEPHTLDMAHRRFAGGPFDAAHSAKADVAATGRVLQGMMRFFELEGRSWNDLAAACNPVKPNWVGPSRHVQWDDGGEVVLGFGKHSGRSILEIVASSDQNYLRWMMKKDDFPPHVHDICNKVFELKSNDFQQWVSKQYGKAASNAT